MIKKGAVLLAVCLLAITVAGCGEDKNAAYVKKVNTLVTENFGGQIEELSSQMGSSENDQVILEQTAKELRELASQLGAIKVPNEAILPDIHHLQNVLRSYASAVAQEALSPDEERFADATQLADSSAKAILNNLNQKL